MVTDNLGSHKRLSVGRVIRAAGAKLFYLPPYSPDLNPIEQVFAKLKHLMRKAAEQTVEATWRRIDHLLDQFIPNECANYIPNDGYASNRKKQTLVVALLISMPHSVFPGLDHGGPFL